MPEHSHDVAHVLVSRESRICFEMTVPCEVKNDQIQSALLEYQPDAFPLLLSVNKTVNGLEYMYEVQAIMVPNEVRVKLITNGFTHAIFYVGSSKDLRKVRVLNEPPTDEMVQTTDYDGDEREYMSGIIVL